MISAELLIQNSTIQRIVVMPYGGLTPLSLCNGCIPWLDGVPHSGRPRDDWVGQLIDNLI